MLWFILGDFPKFTHIFQFNPPCVWIGSFFLKFLWRMSQFLLLNFQFIESIQPFSSSPPPVWTELDCFLYLCMIILWVVFEDLLFILSPWSITLFLCLFLSPHHSFWYWVINACSSCSSNCEVSLSYWFFIFISSSSLVLAASTTIRLQLSSNLTLVLSLGFSSKCHG